MSSFTTTGVIIVEELFLHDSTDVNNPKPDLLVVHQGRNVLRYQKKALIFIGDRYKYVCGNMMLMEAQKFWLLIGRAKLISTNGPSFTFCTQPLLKVAAHQHKTLVKRVR